jgi:hypothetical protein
MKFGRLRPVVIIRSHPEAAEILRSGDNKGDNASGRMPCLTSLPERATLGL